MNGIAPMPQPIPFESVESPENPYLAEVWHDLVHRNANDRLFLQAVHEVMESLTPVLAEASAEQWLLVHADLRNVPRVRIVMDALAELFRARRAEIEGAAVAPTRITEAAD